MENNLPHLLVTDFSTENYTGAGGGNGKNAKPIRKRNEHSAFLKQQLEQAWSDSENEEVVYQARKNGVYLEFKGEEGYELVTKSLENRRGWDVQKWVRLLNVRSETNKSSGVISETIYATIYVPKSKKDMFFTLIEKYANEDSKFGKPRNAALIESISNIRKALEIESFWQDAKNLIPADTSEWCEVWLSSDKDDVVDQFEKLLAQQRIKSKTGFIRFPERAVKIILVSGKQLEMITRFSDDIAEYRRAKETAAFWLDMDNKEQAEWTKNILDRLKVEKNSEVVVCILDTGVNNGHPLIQPILKSQDCQAVDPEWGNHDHDKHGTLMAGVSAYGNIQDILSHNESIRISHSLESVKILPPYGKTEPELWGHVVAQGVYKAEIQSPEKKRINCMAVTSDDTRDRGRPSSWSAELDQICSGAEDNQKRLFVVSAGNASITDPGNYPDSQLTDSIHDPAQSWNALTVGAYTQLDQIRDEALSGYEPVAKCNGLSPFSTTSIVCDDKWPIKPEIVMEGGNLAKDASGFATECADLSLLSTFYDPQQALFSPFNMTSASAAQAAWFAAKVQSEYPDYWPETIRGLMVHSAEWTDVLKDQFLKDESKGSYKDLLRICGYGVPNLQKALYCANNSLTLIAQSELQPFDKKEKKRGCRTKDMHMYDLPWPTEALQSFPDTTEVQMKITLSYFIEPGPGEIGWKDRYRYASHGLRFNLNAPTETRKEFEMRINREARNDDFDSSENASISDHWVIGPQARDKGSIHSDIWKGTAAQLSASNLIAVYPAIGWWRERHHLGKWNHKTRYTLIVSINTPEESVDIYTPVATQIGVSIPVAINV
jgi:hypothetical protein